MATQAQGQSAAPGGTTNRPLYVCGLCDETFESKEACGQHTRTTHQLTGANMNSSPEKNNTEKNNTEKNNTEKNNTGKNNPENNHQPSQDNPTQRSSTESKGKRKASPESKQGDSKKRKRLASESELLQLSLASFSDEEILAKLLERNATFVCKCGIIFRDQAMFSLHRGTHCAKNPFECSFCGFVAPNWYDFMSHFYFHSAEKKDDDEKAS